MVAERRFGPVIVSLFAILGILLVRLFQVQVIEHDVWANEAASLVRSSQLLPSHRGRIEDRDGKALVEDEDVWRVDFVYREFRRGHPLGIVAHARSTLEMRPVSFAEALPRLEEWALELATLSADDLKGFAEGKALKTATLSVPAAPDPKSDLRGSRASDLRFYQAAILRQRPDERAWIREQKPAESLPFAAALAAARGTSLSSVLGAMLAELAKERERLSALARLLPQRAEDAGADRGAGSLTVDGLVARIEAARAKSEDGAADALFEKAAQFTAGRISTSSLVRAFDLAWIARILRWDAPRLRAWEESRRLEYAKDLDEIDVPRILVRAGLEAEDEASEKILDGLASLYSAADKPTPWRETKDVRVLDGVEDLFELKHPPGWDSRANPVLPFRERDFRDTAGSIDEPWLLLGTLAELAGARLATPAVASAHDWAERWQEIAAKDRHLEGPDAHAALRAILDALEARFVGACDSALEACLAEGADEGRSAGPLPLSRDGLERAQQEERFLLKDISSRPLRLCADADYPLVHLLERDADRYRGFEVGPGTRRRMLVRNPEGVPVAHGLIGGVRGPSLREILAEERRRASDGEGSEEEAAEIAWRILRSDEKTGTTGVEALLDPELRGRNGWMEATGLDDGGSEESLRSAVDGQTVRLTLDTDLQLAAEETLEHPVAPPGALTDTTWFHNPVGAIVLLTPDGDVLAAASAPARDGLPPAPERDLERTHARERTLTRPTFNPPGSVFKPFVAVYALDRLGLDPKETFGCGPIDEGYGYQDRFGRMRCHVGGHTSSDLPRALAVSCNATFAQIGERFSPEQMLEMADLFGFGRPTGIRELQADGASPRRGLHEDSGLGDKATLAKRLSAPQNRMRFANGLTEIVATPMQVARATAGLLTGKLPEIRIVQSLGGKPVAKSATDLPFSARAREIVMRALEGVIDQEGGTAHNVGLDRESLGFSFVCKTGTADTRHMQRGDGFAVERKDGQEKMRKQTWIAGWFPKENPKAVLVVMMHDVIEVSTHTSAYLAAQLLRSPAVKRYLEAAPEGATEPATNPARKEAHR